jgi:NMD protein affecting ribosome stability and mRNA decay
MTTLRCKKCGKDRDAYDTEDFEGMCEECFFTYVGIVSKTGD